MRNETVRKAIAGALVAIVVAGCGWVVSSALAKMSSERISGKLCVTKGGGKFVKIPGFPGEKIDRRLKADIAFLVEKYKIYITDGYSLDPVHSANGEHPIGLALDIVPDKAAGGSWKLVSRLARWAEPEQDQPRSPFRWVGYNGDPHHGRGHHLHLSWAHSDTKYDKPARTVYSVKCPKAPGTGTEPPPDDPSDGNEPKKNKKKGKDGGGSSGGLSAGSGSGGSSGGLSSRRVNRSIAGQQNSWQSVESGGVGRP